MLQTKIVCPECKHSYLIYDRPLPHIHIRSSYWTCLRCGLTTFNLSHYLKTTGLQIDSVSGITHTWLAGGRAHLTVE